MTAITVSVVYLGLFLVCFSAVSFAIGEVYTENKLQKRALLKAIDMAYPSWHYCSEKKPPESMRVVVRCTYAKNHEHHLRIAKFKNGKWYSTTNKELKKYIPKSWCRIPAAKRKGNK